MKLFVKNMVCNRCKMVVKSELEKFGLHVISIDLGVVVVENADVVTSGQVNAALNVYGFSLITDKKDRLIERIKNLIVELVHYENSNTKTNLSTYLSDKLNQDYNYISKLFSVAEGITIEKYFIAQKTERVKELIAYNEFTLSEIADVANYSSVAHLSKQFKSVTGFTPTHFKASKNKKRNELDFV